MIESAHYNAQGLITVVIDGARWDMPDDMGNRHRRMLAEWEAEGNSIAPYVPPPTPMPELTPRQLRLALLDIGITEEQIDTKLSGDARGKIEWKYASTYKRNHPLVAQLGAAFGLRPSDMDALWRNAEGI